MYADEAASRAFSGGRLLETRDDPADGRGLAIGGAFERALGLVGGLLVRGAEDPAEHV